MKVSLTLKRKARHAQEHSAVAMIYFGLSTKSYYRQLHLSGFFDTHPCQGMLILATPKPPVLFHKPQNSFLQCTSQTYQYMHLNQQEKTLKNGPEDYRYISALEKDLGCSMAPSLYILTL